MLALSVVFLALPGWMWLWEAWQRGEITDLSVVYGLRERSPVHHPVDLASLHRWKVAAALLGVTVGFLTMLWQVRRIGRVGRRDLPGACVILALLAFASPPSLSTDTLTYTLRGQMISVFGFNPYHFAPAETASDVDQTFVPTAAADRRSTRSFLTLLELDPWAHQRCAYGFSWAWVMACVRWLGGVSITANVLLYKALGLGALLTVLWLVWRLWPPEDSRGRLITLALLGLNPAMVLETAAMGHAEGVMMALWVGATLALRRGRLTLAGALLGFAAGIKWVPLAAAPLMVLWLMRRVRRARGIGLFLAAFAATLVLPAIRFEPWRLATWEGLRQQSRLFGGGSLIHVLGLVWTAVSGDGAAPLAVAKALRVATLAAMLAILARRARRGVGARLEADQALLALLIAIGASSFFHPWYVLWALPFAVLGRRQAPRLCAVTVALSLAAPLSLIAPIWAGDYGPVVQWAMFFTWAVPTLTAVLVPPRLSLFFESAARPINESSSSSISAAI